MTAGMNISTEDIQEMDILKGGFDAEYGNIQSAAVNIITKEGRSKKTDVRIDFLTDDFGSKNLNKYSFNTDRLEFSIGGPEKLFSQYLLPSFLTKDILPSLGIDLTSDKLTYRISGSVYKSDTYMDVNKSATPLTAKKFRVDDFLGFNLPERMSNFYTAQLKLSYKISPTQKLVFSYNGDWERYTLFFDPTSETRGDISVWEYRYTPSTLPQFESSSKTFSLLFTHNVSRSSFYELTLSKLSSDFLMAPGDPNKPGGHLDPEDFIFSDHWQNFSDRNHNGKWDPAEQFIDVNGNGKYDKGEPLQDANGNGTWDSAEPFSDPDSLGYYDPSRARMALVDDAEPYLDGDVLLGEPYTEVNGDGIYEEGIDVFNPLTDDLNGNGIYDGPTSDPCPGLQNCPTLIPYVDRNHNGVYDKPNGRWDPGESYTDMNGNGKYDGVDGFFDRGYERRTYYQHRTEDRLTLDFKFTSQVTKQHQIKTGFRVQSQKLTMADMRYPYYTYNGVPDGGPWPDHGIFRDFYTRRPVLGAAFLQDNIEYGEMIAKLGARLDLYIQPNDVVYMARSREDEIEHRFKKTYRDSKV